MTTMAAGAPRRRVDGIGTKALAGRDTVRIHDVDDSSTDVDPGTVILTCANCGAAMDERKCKLICRCGYFLSCSDYY